MHNSKKALIIGTRVAVSQYESGASIRFNYLRTLVATAGFEVTSVHKKNCKAELRKNWDLIVLISFSTASLLRKSRIRTKNLWFDPTDSWTLTRISLFHAGELKQIALLVRDLFWIRIAPKIDLITFITSRDLEKEKKWANRSNSIAVIPIAGLTREVSSTSEIRLVFVGDGQYGPNIKALRFLEEVLDKLPTSYLIHVYGGNYQLTNSRFVFHGYTHQSNIYKSNDIHLAPVKYGAGLKLKVAVPLWNGIQVISTPEGAKGFNSVINLHIASTPKKFSEKIELLHNLYLQQKLALKPNPNIFCDNDIRGVESWIASI
jgi:hypothetical protein